MLRNDKYFKFNFYREKLKFLYLYCLQVSTPKDVERPTEDIPEDFQIGFKSTRIYTRYNLSKRLKSDMMLNINYNLQIINASTSKSIG